MQATLLTPSRMSGQFADLMRQKLHSEEFESGHLLPGERSLARQYKLSAKTVRRALKILEAEALIAPESRRGYRVLERASDPGLGHPLALVISKPPTEGADWFYRRIMSELQNAAARRGWSLLCIQREGRTTAEIVANLKAARAGGAIVESAERDVIDTIARMGIPTVQTDAWCQDGAVDSILQDGFAGAMLAAEHLASLGCKRLAFVGLDLKGGVAQKVERFGGAAAGAVRAGLFLDAERCVYAPSGDQSIPICRARVRALLDRSDRPDGIIAPWQSLGVGAALAARDAGLQIGRDIHLVGWSTKEDYETEFAQKFQSGRVPVAVVWSVAQLAEICILRLMQRRADPKLPVSVTRVPMALRLPGKVQRI